MKTFKMLLFSVALAVNAFGQSASPTATAPAIISSGPHHRIWQWQVTESLPDGRVVMRPHQYTELASGLNVLDSSGNWTPAQATIEAFAGGAVSQRAQGKIIFANNLNTEGAIDVSEPDGKRLRSNILGLMYDDPATGQTVVIAQIQDSEGEIISDNQILYPNAFEGVHCDVMLTTRIDGMEQDVIIKEQLPDPQLFAMNPDTVEVVCFSEFLQPPTATVSDAADSTQTQEADQTVKWGVTSLGHGRAFSLDGQDVPVTVRKRYTTINGRHFLLEKTRYKDIQQPLSKLPDQASNARRLRGMASKNPALPKTPAAKTATRPVKLALGARPNIGYVLDYVTLATAYTNFTFQGDTTYYVSSTLSLSGTNVFEPNTILKFAANASINFVAGSMAKFLSAPFRPIILTSKDDNSVGEGFGSGSPSGYYANPALNFASMGSVTLSDLRISYANRGISASGASPYLYNAQFVNCATAISDLNGAATLENVLFSNVKTNFNATSAANTVSVQNATFNNTFDIINGSFANTYLCLTNCAFVNVTNHSGNLAAGYNGFYRTPMVGSQAVTNTFYPLQVAGAASAYLTNGCSFVNAGTVNIDLNTLTLIAAKTVYAPIIFSSVTLNSATNLYPQAQRDNAGNPSLGYHYCPLDYTFGNTTANSNLTVAAGTAVGWFYTASGNTYGLAMANNATANFNGTATAPCYWVKYNTVQEGGNGNWTAQSYRGALVGLVFSPAAPAMKAGFTLFSLPATEAGPVGSSVFVGNNCEFYSGSPGGYYASLNLTNCLFVNAAPGIWDNYQAGNLSMQGCTCFRGNLLAVNSTGGAWPVSIQNCAFDSTTFQMSSSNPNGYYSDYNSFLLNSNRTAYPGPHDLTVTNSYNWQTSWLGRFYLPPNSPLIDKGSTNANLLGLYHFTTQTNQTVEGTSIVDIGYHVVAVDAYGNPLDSNLDGIPDYIEDSNGNGLADAGEQPWNIPATGLKLWLRADAGITAISNQVSLWADQSGSANHASQTISYAQPLYITNAVNGLPAVWFSGTNNSSWTNGYLNLPDNLLNGAAAAEAFAVVKATSAHPANIQSLWEFGGNPWRIKSFPDTYGNIADDFGSAAVQTVGIPAAPVDQYNVYQVSSQPNNWAAWLNGMMLYQTNVNTVTFPSMRVWPLFAPYVLGGAPLYGSDGLPSYFAGDIAEVLVFNRALNANERTMVNAYLNSKYGLVPAVAIAIPTNTAVYPTGANIPLSANASQPGGGSIKQVEFFQGSTSLGVVTSPPYSLTWNNVAAGSMVRNFYALTARATGVNGLMATSSVVNIAVDPPPIVSITTPATAYLGIAPVNVALAASAADITGIQQVQFFQGSTSLGVVAIPPFNLNWTGVPAGNYALTFVATGNDGLSATSAIFNVIVDSDTDGDGQGDWLESQFGTNPNRSDEFRLWVGTPGGSQCIP